MGRELAGVTSVLSDGFPGSANRMRTRAALLGLLAAPAWALVEFPDCERGPLSTNKVCDPLASPRERAAALVVAMTVEEKLVNLVEYVVNEILDLFQSLTSYVV
jgi:hypothetical protein